MIFFRKVVPTFRDHALARQRGRAHQVLVDGVRAMILRMPRTPRAFPGSDESIVIGLGILS
jgi:hypothetical protein